MSKAEVSFSMLRLEMAAPLAHLLSTHNQLCEQTHLSSCEAPGAQTAPHHHRQNAFQHSALESHNQQVRGGMTEEI